MKYGGVAPQPSGMDRYVSLMSQMRASTVRVSMFLGDTSYRRFDNPMLDRLIAAQTGAPGRAEVIINSSEFPHGDRCRWELGPTGLFEYIQSRPETLFIYELGNEPDRYYPNPNEARWRVLTAIRDVRPLFQAPNLLWAVNMPSQGKPDGTAPDDWYYYNFVRDIGDGLGPIIPGQFTGIGDINMGNVPNTITAHCYGFATLCQTDDNRPTKVLNFIRNWNLEMNIKVTEAGIPNQELADSGERGRRYVDFGESVLPYQFGNADSVTFYTLGDADPDPMKNELVYNMTDAEAQQIGLRARAGLC